MSTAYQTETLDIGDDEREFVRPVKHPNYSSTFILLVLTAMIVIGVVVSPYLFVSIQEKTVPLTTASLPTTTNAASVPIPISVYPDLDDEDFDEQEAFASTQADRQSYGELARESMQKILPTVVSEAKDLHYFVAPSTVKPVRKAVQKLRDFLDIFYAAYFPVGNHDYWQELRHNFEKGYKVLGEFQDLTHSGVLYTEMDAADLRANVLHWRKKHLKLMKQFDVAGYLYNPDTEETNESPSRKPSRWYWGGTDLHPSLKLTGLQNMALLLNDALERLRGRQQEAIRLPEIYSEENHDSFHGFRKRCRTVINLIHYFPKVLASKSKEATAALDLISSIYDQYGDLNDQWTAWNFYKTKGSPSDADMVDHYHGLVEQGWQRLKAAQVAGGQLDVSRAVQVLQKALINF